MWQTHLYFSWLMYIQGINYATPRIFQCWLESNSDFVKYKNDGPIFSMCIHAWMPSAIYPDLRGRSGEFI
jgi:hypothetical protein